MLEALARDARQRRELSEAASSALPEGQEGQMTTDGLRMMRRLAQEIRVRFNGELPAGRAEGPVFSTAALVPIGRRRT
jgi:hypothetical protein